MRQWKIGETNGTIIAGGYGQGTRPNRFNRSTYLSLLIETVIVEYKGLTLLEIELILIILMKNWIFMKVFSLTNILNQNK